jgi:hypothetical protein
VRGIAESWCGCIHSGRAALGLDPSTSLRAGSRDARPYTGKMADAARCVSAVIFA